MRKIPFKCVFFQLGLHTYFQLHQTFLALVQNNYLQLIETDLVDMACCQH